MYDKILLHWINKIIYVSILPYISVYVATYLPSIKINF